MGRYIAKRAVLLVIIIFFVSVAAFFLVHLLPGNPAVAILGPNDTPQNAAILNHQLGLDKPLWQQYFIWIGHVFQGNLGQSFTTHQTTMSIISESFPIDIELIVFSQILAAAVALPMAIRASRRPNRLFDQSANGAAFGMLALPPFVIGPVLVLIFAVHWHVFPGPASYVPLTQDFWSNIHTMLLPAIILALGSIVVYFRLLRNDLIATLQEDFITMARSKGLTDRRIMWRHAPAALVGFPPGRGRGDHQRPHRGHLRRRAALAAPRAGTPAHHGHQPGRLHGGAGHHPGRRGGRGADQLLLRLPLHHRRPEDRP